MLRNLEDLRGTTLRATDGEIGGVKDFYFDDQRWVVRYLVAETGGWLSSRPVLISPMSLATEGHEDSVIALTISRSQVEHSPPIDTDRPVSRQHELDYLGYYGYPNYWDSVGLWGAGAMMPGLVAPDAGMTPAVGGVDDPVMARAADARHARDDPHLRSCDEVVGYDVKASDGEIGHVKGFVVDDASWALRYLIVDTSRWLFGHLVLISPQWIESVSWEDRQVAVSMAGETIRSAPAWDGATLPDRDSETALYQHYQRSGYW